MTFSKKNHEHNMTNRTSVSKNIIISIVLICTIFSLSAQITILEEGFESGTFPPEGWVTYRGVNDIGPNNDWITSTNSNSGTTAAFSRYANQNIGIAEDWLVTQMIDLSNSNNSELRFFSRETWGTAYESQYDIKVSTSSQTNHSDFITIATYGDFPLDYQQLSVDLSAYDGQQIYIAFVHIDEYQDNWSLDDISVINTNFVIDNITYNPISNNTVEVTSACMETINIPETVTHNGITYDVVKIGDWAFFNCQSVITINIPDSIVTIGFSAFRNTSITSLTIPNSVSEIGAASIYSCNNLNSVVLPNQLTTINNFMFAYCNNLSSITIPDTVTSINQFAFFGCNSITEINIPENVTHIGNSSFSDLTNLNNVIVNWDTPLEGDSNLHPSAFNNTDITSITLNVPPETVALYEAAPIWTDFSPILEIGEVLCDIDVTAEPNVNLGRTGSTNMYAQEFISNCDGNLDKFAFFARVIPEFEQILPAGTFNIYEGNPETGNIIYSQSFDAIVPVGDGELLFDLNNNIQVAANQTYSIEIPVTLLNISILYSDPYPHGYPYINGNILTSGWDFFFTVNVVEESLSTNTFNTETFRIVPNPTTDYISISNLNTEESYVIYDVLGKKLTSGMLLTGSKISVQNLEKGIYFLKLDGYETLRFIKN